MKTYTVEDKYGNVIEFCEAKNDEEALVIARDLVHPDEFFVLTDEDGNRIGATP